VNGTIAARDHRAPMLAAAPRISDRHDLLAEASRDVGAHRLHHPVWQSRRFNMKLTHLTGLIAVLVVSACSTPISLKTDVSSFADFSRYHTIAVKQGNPSSNPVMDARVMDDVADTFVAKGYRRVAEDQADAIAVVNAATEEKHTYSVFYDGWSGWGWGYGMGYGYGWNGYGYGWPSSTVQEYSFTVGSVVVDVFDGHSKRAVWHGQAGDVTLGNPEKDAAKMRAAIGKLMAKYPPAAV
jgi:hypothetical protein